MMASPVLGQTQCKVEKLAELPVTMDGLSPIVEAKVNGVPVRFILDSGAFTSVVTPGTAVALGLKPEPVRDRFMVGINGSTRMSLVKVDSFSVGGANLGHAQMVVGGSEVGEAGVLGQDLLGFADIEYDLPHGMVRLFKPQGCDQLSMAYWAVGRPFEEIAIEAHSPGQPHTIGKVQLNGKSMDAMFDTGAPTSMVMLSAASRAGVRPYTPGVKPADSVSGFGRGYVQAWAAPFASFKIGDEEIRNTNILIGAGELDADMLIGADFFIAHRVYVSNAQHKMFFTYEGGPVFNLKARQQDAQGRDVKSEPVTQAELGDAAALGRSGAVALARQDYDQAIADLGKAIARAPTEPQYLLLRAEAYGAKEQKDKALADLDKALSLTPNDVRALIMRAALRIDKEDKAGALVDLGKADQIAGSAADEKYRIAELFLSADAPARAIAPISAWITAHPIDSRHVTAINFRCWVRGLGNQDLAAGLDDCNDVLRLVPGALDARDGKGMIDLRLGEWGKAIGDFDTVIAKRPKSAWSLYGRGIARQRQGDTSGSKADIDAARAAWPKIDERARLFDLVP